jgi:beta-lactamase regulating signal transducer with metallopeptidase domain
MWLSLITKPPNAAARSPNGASKTGTRADMDFLTQTFGTVDPTLAFCWIAGGVALLFVMIVVGDYVGQRRKYRRRPPSSRANAGGGFLNFLLKPGLTAKVPVRRRRK